MLLCETQAPPFAVILNLTELPLVIELNIGLVTVVGEELGETEPIATYEVPPSVETSRIILPLTP